MTKMFYCDIETFSRVDLPKSNVYAYTEDPSFEILMLGWAYDDEPVKLTTDPGEIHRLIAEAVEDEDTLLVAHNAPFERICFSREIDLPLGEYLDPRMFIDTAALAAVNGYPRKLEHLATALGAEAKDSAGTRLINIFCKPDRHGVRTYAEDKPEEWERFKVYGSQDVATLRDVYRRLPEWPSDAEADVYYIDQTINDRGIATDWDMARAAVEAATENRTQDLQEMKDITGLANPNSTAQLLEWLHDRRVKAPDLQKKTVDRILANKKLTEERYPTVRRVLELRQETALVAAQKYTAALRCLSQDSRLRGAFRYHGAHTGRWSGSGVQLQNLPSLSLVPKDTSEAEADRILDDAVYALKVGVGADGQTLKALVRQLFVGPFTVVDYAAIEARVISWLGGEGWALEAFAEGRDIYVETAERMSSPEQTLTRKEGKVAVLALGYQGGLGALRAMGAEGEDEALWFLVNQWREANPNIVQLWRELDAAFRAGDRAVGDHLYVHKDEKDRYIELPSGRKLAYRGLQGRREFTKYGQERVRVSFMDPKKPGLRTDTYGGRLAENVTQAVARDILAEAMVRLERAGYRIAGHVHDEVIIEGTHEVDTVAELMSEPVPWSAGLPVAAAGYRTQRYRKD